MTASVTIAPITPATAFDIPPPDDELAVADGEVELEVEVDAQIPVVFPQAVHQSAWSAIANLFISSTNVFQGRTTSLWLNNGYAVKGFSAAVPLANRNRTEI